jgi:hypothetical protein
VSVGSSIFSPHSMHIYLHFCTITIDIILYGWISFHFIAFVATITSLSCITVILLLSVHRTHIPRCLVSFRFLLVFVSSTYSTTLFSCFSKPPMIDGNVPVHVRPSSICLVHPATPDECMLYPHRVIPRNTRPPLILVQSSPRSSSHETRPAGKRYPWFCHLDLT